MQLTDYVGRILFPQQDRWERRRNVKALFITLSILLVAVLFGLIFIRKKMQQNELNPEPQRIIQPALPS
jgi:membrane glycosyltransferase